MGRAGVIGEIRGGGSNKQKLPWVLLAVIILFLSAYMVYWGTQKVGYHIDEMFSMMDIRGGGLGRPYNDDGFFNTWHAAPDLESTIGVSSQNAFSAIGQYRSLHRILLHIAYSLKPDEFTIWPSMMLNLLILAGSLIVIYLLSLMFIDNKYLALLPGLAWGLSSAAVNLVLFIRFYALKTFLCLLLTYVVFIAVKNGFCKWKHLVAILVITGIGALVHQYFLVYAFFLTAFVCIYLLASKEYKPLLKFAGVMIAAAAAYQLITGFGISYLFVDAEGRAEEAVENLLFGNAGYLGRIQEYFNIVCEAVFGSIDIYAVMAFAAVLVLIIFMAYNRKDFGFLALLRNQKTAIWLVMGAVCLFYLLLIARIAPYQEIRYIFCITPFIVILFVALLTYVLRAIGFKSTVTVFVMVSMLFLFLPYGNIKKFNLHWEPEMAGEALEPYHHLPVVCISNRKLDVAVCYWQIFKFENQVFFTLTGNVDADAINRLSFDDGLLLLFQSPEGEADVKIIMDATGLDRSTYVTELVRHTVYYLGKR